MFPVRIAVVVMARRAYLAVWIVAWVAEIVGGGTGVTKCCPRDMVLKIDMVSCTEFVGDDQDSRKSYVWTPNVTTDAVPAEDVNGGNTTTVPPYTDDVSFSVSNSSIVPWWIPDNMEFLRAANLSLSFKPDTLSFDADGRIPCHPDGREVIIINDDVAVLDDGRLVMFRNENRLASADERLTIPSTEYCVDRVSLLDNYSVTGAGDPKSRKNRRRRASGGGKGVVNPTYTYVVLICRPCSKIMCVQKCCAKNLVLEYKNEQAIGCRKTLSPALAIDAIRLKAENGTELKKNDYFFFGMKPPDCGNRSSYIFPSYSSYPSNPYGFGLLPDGRMMVDDGVEPIKQGEYCVDAMNAVTGSQVAAGMTPAYTNVLLACRLSGVASATVATVGPLEFREILYGTYFVVGTTFLAATLLIYAMLPELRVTVHSGNLIAHTVCLFVSYATLAATTLIRQAFNYSACVVAGFVIQFSFLAAFFWLNVMCADIAWTFSGFRLLLYSNKIENEKKKYVIYSVYAWGSSIGISILTALAEFTNLVGESNYKPNFGHKDCWFSNKSSVGVFFYLPIGLLLLTNFILFLFTAFRIVFIRRDTSKVLNRQINQNNMRLSLYLKLFCLMGVTFVFEVISWAVQAPAYYWYATDAVNSLRGVFVFFIFCWKRSVLHLLLARTPENVRQRIIRTFGITEPHRHPSFSSMCQPNQFGGGTSTRTQSTSTSAQITGGGGRNSSFQLSQFGSSVSVTPAARRNSSVRH